jgi:hypothetical protein
MEITPIGWILIPLGVLLFFRPKWLYILAVFFTPFTATAIVNRGTGENAAGIQPYLWFGTILIFRKAFDLAYSLRFRLRHNIRRPLLIYLGFVCVCIISLSMPFIVDGHAEVLSNGTLEATLVPVRFGSKNISALISLVFGFGFTVLVAKQCMVKREFLKTLRIYMVSGIFICFWGFLQFGLGLLNIPYPYFIFNNNASPYAQLGGAMSLLNVVRISSVAMEPSALSVILVGMFAIQLVSILSKRYIFRSGVDRLTLVVLWVGLMLTGSGTGYIGLASTCILAYILFIKGHKRAFGRTLLLSILTGLFIGLLFALPPTRLYMQEAIFSKADSVSALERGTIILADMRYFLNYPILGLGWGTAPAHDLTMGLLANCGAVGLISFFTLIAYLIVKLLRPKTNAGMVQVERKHGIMLVPLVATIISYLVDSMPAGGTFSLLLGLAIAEAALLSETKSIRSSTLNYAHGSDIIDSRMNVD